MARAGAKLMLVLCAAATGVLLAEGLVSLAGNRSLLRLVRDGSPVFVRQPATSRRPGPADDWRAVLSRDALFCLHRDPLVGYVLRPDAELELLDSAVHSDHLGLRARPGQPAPDDALRLVVLGDSVAFGYGLDDEQTLAFQLELQLGAVRGAGLPPVVARTVAMPGWNHRNAVSFLLDHFDELDPDVVVYLPIANDLSDTDGVQSSGLRCLAPDIASRDPWLQVSSRAFWPLLEQQILLADSGRAMPEAFLGPQMLTSDLLAESRRRYEANAASIAKLAGALQPRGCPLLLVCYENTPYYWHLQRHLHELGCEPDTQWLFESVPPEFQLAGDPHPNARTVSVMATWIAEELLRRGWLDRGAGLPLPQVESSYGDLHAQPRSIDAIVAASEGCRKEATSSLRPAVDLTSFEGIRQVYGTLNDDATVAMRMLLALAPGGTRVVVRLAPLVGRPDLYPLAVGVEIDGQLAGSLHVTADGEAEGRWPVPARTRAKVPIEVRLMPERWVVVPQGENTRLASFRPLRIACER